MTNPNITPELERAARAMYEAYPFGRPMEGEQWPWDYMVEQGWPAVAVYRSLAIACLRSLLPPSEGMVEAGCMEADYDEFRGDAIFTAMIKHVLGEG